MTKTCFQIYKRSSPILAESDILSDHADGLGSDVQERGDVNSLEEKSCKNMLIKMKSYC